MAEQNTQQSPRDRQVALETRAMEKLAGFELSESTAPAKAPPAVAEEPVEELEATDQVEEQSETGETTTQEEAEDVDFDDFKFSLPKTHAQKLKDVLQQRAAFTRGNQEIAEARRGLTAKERVITEQQAFHQSALDDIAMIRGIDAQIKQYEQVNWQGLDTDTLVRTKHQLDQLKDARAGAERTLNAKAQDFRSKREAALKDLAKAGYNTVTQKVSGFNEATAKQVRDYVESEGFTADEISQIFDPRQVIAFYKAMKWDQLQAQKPGITKRANEVPPVVKAGAAMKQVPADQAAVANFRKAKTQQDKVRLGSDILMRKMRI